MKNSLCSGIFFKSLAVLMFEVCLTRILSITLWHHFAFLIISCALLGYGASGAILVVWPRIKDPFYPAFLFAVTLLPLVVLATSVPIQPAMLSLDPIHWLNLLVIFLILTLPFVFSGLTINILFRNHPENVSTLYCFDLLGAAAGCGLFFVIAPYLPELSWVGCCAVFGAIAAVFLTDGRRKRGIAIVLLFFGLIMLYFQQVPPLSINQYKSLPLALRLKGSYRIRSQWNPVVRVDQFESPLMRHAPGISLNYRGPLPSQSGLALDTEMLTVMTSWNFSSERFIRALPVFLPFELCPEKGDTLVLNTLGGADVLPALMNGGKLDVQTENTILADWHRDSGIPERIRLITGSARSVLAGGHKHYDKILVSLEGSLPSGFSGVDSLKSTSLWTVEGVESMLDNLDPGGWLAFHVYLLPPPRTELKLLATLIQVLANRQLDPWRHVGILQTIATMMIVVSPAEWSSRQSAVFQEFCRRNGFIPILYPGASPEIRKKAMTRTALFAGPVYDLFHDPDAFQARSVFNLEPVTDGRPYFNRFIRLNRFRDFMAQFDYKWEAALEGGLLLIPLLIVVSFLSIVLIGFPFIIRRRTISFFSGPLFYFVWIGLGFMAVEIGLIEQLSLFLGEPVYSFAVVLGALLLTAGVGSLATDRFRKPVINFLLMLSIPLFIGYSLLLSAGLAAFRGLPLPGRIMLAIGLSGLAGIFIGGFFPSGIRVLSGEAKTENRDRIALAWCYNGMASVAGSVGAMLVCQFLGFRFLYGLAAGCYFMAVISVLARKSQS